MRAARIGDGTDQAVGFAGGDWPGS
ncbi:hypothetical protein LCGC14_2081350, partial [marine sediment metagenome]